MPVVYVETAFPMGQMALRTLNMACPIERQTHFLIVAYVDQMNYAYVISGPIYIIKRLWWEETQCSFVFVISVFQVPCQACSEANRVLHVFTFIQLNKAWQSNTDLGLPVHYQVKKMSCISP